MDAFILEHHKGTGHQAMADLVNAKFGTSFTKGQMKNYYNRNKLNSGLTGRFEKGHEPWTKGKKWADYMSEEAQERSRKTCYDHAHIPENALPVGSIRMTKDGYLIKKVQERGYQWERWQLLHRLIWEEHNGPIPKGQVLTFKNGDKTDCRLENLALITQEENKSLNKKHLRSQNPEITEAAISLGRL